MARGSALGGRETFSRLLCPPRSPASRECGGEGAGAHRDCSHWAPVGCNRGEWVGPPSTPVVPGGCSAGWPLFWAHCPVVAPSDLHNTVALLLVPSRNPTAYRIKSRFLSPSLRDLVLLPPWQLLCFPKQPTHAPLLAWT